MPDVDAQPFLRNLDRTLGAAADRPQSFFSALAHKRQVWRPTFRRTFRTGRLTG
jgi:hypothetical protein